MNARPASLVPVAMRILLMLLVLAGTALADPDWKGAEKLVRDHMAAQKLTVVDVKTRPKLPFGTAFWVQVKDAAGAASQRFVVVRGTTVYDTPGEATLSAVLKADDFLKTRKLDDKFFFYLVRELVALPAGLGTPITSDPDGRVGPKLTFEKDRATFVVRSGRKGNERGAPTVPRAYYTKATLTIASDYKLSWKLEDETLPLK